MGFAILLLLLAATASSVLLQGVSGQCPTEDQLIAQFNTASSQQKIYYGPSGGICQIEQDDGHDEDEHEDEHEDDHDHRRKRDHDEHHNEEEEDHDEHHDEEEYNVTNTTSCDAIYKLCRSVIIDLGLTTEECLEDHGHDNETSSGVSEAEAYGYGFLMVVFVSLCSLGGVFLVPLIKSSSETGMHIYDHVYAFMVAIAISALVSDAVLHLIPHAFELHGHEEGDGHAHEEEEENLNFLWKGCLVLLGIYAFYLLELFLHTCGHTHHGDEKKVENNIYESSVKYHCPTDDVHYTSSIPTPNAGFSGLNELKKGKNQHAETATQNEKSTKTFLKMPKIKPVAWLIIIGDGVHNLADGIALGAAISQSLSLGLSTMFALIFHELPHEFGDFVILVKSGFHWGVALLINFLQSLTAVVGLFIGVAISTRSESASNWILSITAGLFLYIALTDLLPELIHGEGHNQMKNSKVGQRKWNRLFRFVLVNLGFLLAFAILLVLAVYEEDLNTLI